MNAKKFFYVCAGIFLLAGAYTIGARNARADLRTSTGYILGFWNGNGPGSPAYALRSDGTIWIKSGSGWQQAAPPFAPVPFPIDGAILGTQFTVMTQDGHIWTAGTIGGPGCGIAACWSQDPDFIPPPPSVAVQGKTWSGVKDTYRAHK